MDQVSLQVSDNTVKAMEYAFEEAKQRLTSMHQSFDPFTVTVVDEGLEVNDHPAATPTSVRESVKMLLAQDMPEGYALCYDGYVETDDGQQDAVIVEVADRGASDAFILALLYGMEEGRLGLRRAGRRAVPGRYEADRKRLGGLASRGGCGIERRRYRRGK